MVIYLTSDLHLGHSKIIEYCNRPFNDVELMNKYIITRWNETISKSDNVYFLGDLSFHTEKWIPLLNGNITFIKGNHDRFKDTESLPFITLKYHGERFYLIHNPHDVPPDWEHYIIHGHVHNTKPFRIDERTFNVSSDVTFFRPIELSYILEQIENGEIT